MKIKLWAHINRWLRYTGFRVSLHVDRNEDGSARTPSTIDLYWAGLPGSDGWEWHQP